MSFSDFHITWSNPAGGRSANSALGEPPIAQSDGDETAAVAPATSTGNQDPASCRAVCGAFL
jgi:hypothetical protein